jgi:pSer/pThr/pTyr-binding forkhead associated (FHA) protein
MDLGSKNHTYLNGTQITQPTELAMWSQIQVGKSAFRVINMGKS